MFGWLLRQLRGGGRKQSRSANAFSGARLSARHEAFFAKSNGKGEDESFLERLTREVGELQTLSPDEQQLTSELVERVARHVRTHKVEPPVMPALASRMLDLLRQPEVDVQALARLIERDQATAGRLLSIANSALFRGAREIESVRDAIVFLGTEQVAQIAIGLATRTLFQGNGRAPGAAGDDLWPRLFLHAMTTAFTACQLATQRNRRHSDAAFLGGLFHDVGKAVALRALSEVASADAVGPLRPEVIDAALRMLHSDPTAVLYDSWKLPQQLITMCRHHHVLDGESTPELHFVRLVSALDVLRVGSDVDKREALDEVAESAAALKLSDPELRVAQTETREYGERVAAMFG